MTEITIAFRPDLEQLILRSRKTSTWRRSRKGLVGDTFTVRGRRYMITYVKRQDLDETIWFDNLSEGFDSPAECQRVMEEIYGTPLDGRMMGYIHYFYPIVPTNLYGEEVRASDI